MLWDVFIFCFHYLFSHSFFSALLFPCLQYLLFLCADEQVLGTILMPEFVFAIVLHGMMVGLHFFASLDGLSYSKALPIIFFYIFQDV